MEHRCPRVAFPFERVAQLHEFTVQALEAACFGQRPRTHARSVKEGQGRRFGGLNASPVQRHEGAGFVVEEHRQTKVNMEETDEAVEGQVVLGGHGNAGLVEALKGALSMEFGGMKHHHRCVLRRFTQRLEQPRREPFPRWDVFRTHECFVVHFGSPTVKDSCDTSST